jgi:hypothetical protein
MKKRSVLSVTVLLVLVVPLFAQSADEFGIKQNRQGGITIVDYLGFAEHVVFPATIEGIKVTEIDIHPAAQYRRTIQYMSGSQRITSVVIPNTVTRIGEGVFSSDRYLNKITIGSNVNIAQNAFPNNFVDFYLSQGRKAGTYTWTGRLWRVGQLTQSSTPQTETMHGEPRISSNNSQPSWTGDQKFQDDYERAVRGYDRRMQGLPPGLVLPGGKTVQETIDSAPTADK